MAVQHVCKAALTSAGLTVVDDDFDPSEVHASSENFSHHKHQAVPSLNFLIASSRLATLRLPWTTSTRRPSTARICPARLHARWIG